MVSAVVELIVRKIESFTCTVAKDKLAGMQNTVKGTGTRERSCL